MKRQLFKSFDLLAIILTLAIDMSAIGQNGMYAISNLISDKSIVREYKDNTFVVFNNGSGGPTFNLVDINTMAVKTFDMGPADINDFEIFRGKVYFCGNVGTQALIGWFDIQATFDGLSQVYHGYLPPMACNQYPGYTDHFTDAKKIELMEVGGNMHLLVVGESYCTHTSAQPTRFFADVYFDGISWMLEATQEHSGIFFYDDVAVTNNLVVPVGHKNHTNAEYIYAFSKPTTPNVGTILFNNPTPIYPYIQNYTTYCYAGYYCHIIDSLAEVIIEHITDDIYATAYHGQIKPTGDTNYVFGTILNIYNGSPGPSAITSRNCVTPFSLKYRDFKFNPGSNSLQLLPGAWSPYPNEYLEFFLDPTHTTLISVHEHVDLSATGYSSLDACRLSLGHGRSIISGHFYDLRIWRHELLSENRCSLTRLINYQKTLCDQWGRFEMDIYYNKVPVPIGAYDPTISLSRVKPVCIEEDQ